MTDTTDDLQPALGRWAAQPFAYLITTGRHSGTPHRIEIQFAVDDGSVYLLSGGRDRSDWVRNLQADPAATIELDDWGRASLPFSIDLTATGLALSDG